jgi:hypothetical protein
MTITVSKTETNLLIEAAGRGGALVIPETTKPATRQRLLGRFERDGLVRAHEDGHVLTRAGYGVVGLREPRKRAGAVPGEEPITSPAGAKPCGSARPGTKLALIQELLGRGEGATLAELIAATAWLPHTTRAALSRIRSAGQALTKGPRPDGKIAYRIETEAGPVDAASESAESDAASASHASASSARRGRRKAAGDVVQAVA